MVEVLIITEEQEGCTSFPDFYFAGMTCGFVCSDNDFQNAVCYA